MRIRKRGNRYWADFRLDGVRYRKPLRTSKYTDAQMRAKELLAAAERGGVRPDAKGPKRLLAAIESYLQAKRLRCSARTIELEKERLSIVTGHFADCLLTSITAGAIADYQAKRNAQGIANRTINMDVGVLSRVLKYHGQWKRMADHVHMLPERPALIGRALTGGERQRLFDAASSNPEWEHVHCAAVVAANTSMRPVEVKHLRRRDVDLFKRTVTVARSKNVTSHRVIPLNASAVKALARMIERADQLGFTEPDHFLWPACQWGRLDPTKATQKWDTAWRALRDKAGLPGLRFHDLRHTIITELAEIGVADHVLESITGHLSRRMLEHYSHIRLDAKRKALEALDEMRNDETARPEPAGTFRDKPRD